MNLTESYERVIDSLLLMGNEIDNSFWDSAGTEPTPENQLYESKKYKNDKEKIDQAYQSVETYIEKLLDIFEDGITSQKFNLNKTNSATRNLNKKSLELYEIITWMESDSYKQLTTEYERNYLKECITDYFAKVQIARKVIDDYNNVNEAKVTVPKVFKEIKTIYDNMSAEYKVRLE